VFLGIYQLPRNRVSPLGQAGPAPLRGIDWRERSVLAAGFSHLEGAMPEPHPTPEATEPSPPSSLGVQRQMEIYQAGLRGQKPALPLAAEVLEERAREVLPPEAFTYVAGGAGGEDTMRANREAFRRWQIVPRFLRDVARRDLSVSVLGQRLAAPVLLAPIGV